MKPLAAVPLLLAGCVASRPAERTVTTPHAAALPFIEDDYPRALAEARARKLPIFVDAWAPW